VVSVLLSVIGLESETMTAEKTPVLRCKSMELLKELTQILQEIIGSGDEESFRRLEETIRAIHEDRRKLVVQFTELLSQRNRRGLAKSEQRNVIRSDRS
jgi:hypothetical protein